MVNDKSKIISISDFSPHLFWDVERETVFFDKNHKWLINRVLEYGLLSDWLLLEKQYGINEIVTVALKLKDLSKKTASFLSVLSGLPKEKFVCYSTEQSQNHFWNS